MSRQFNQPYAILIKERDSYKINMADFGGHFVMGKVPWTLNPKITGIQLGRDSFITICMYIYMYIACENIKPYVMLLRIWTTFGRNFGSHLGYKGGNAP